MGADLIGVGYTVLNTTQKPGTLAEVEAWLRAQPDEAVRALFDSGAERMGLDWGEVVDDALAEVLLGAETLWDQGGRYGSVHIIPGHADRVFVFAGATTWGDDPFDGFTEACIVLEAEGELADALRARLHILGGGIVLD